MNLLRIIYNIINHPLGRLNKLSSIYRFLFWQLRNILTKSPYEYQFTSKSKLLITKGMKGATGNIYTGLHEFYEMAFLLHFLEDNDVFVDVGANVGTYTVLASAHIGAKTFSFEPVPTTYSYLCDNIKLNKIEDKVNSRQMGVSKSKGTLNFTSNLDVENHIDLNMTSESIKVEIDSLDNLILHQKPVLLKIDVEGFEMDVLSGAKELLKTTNLKAVIIELIGLGEKYGFDESQARIILNEAGFKPYKYDPFKRRLIAIESFETDNTIYIKDTDFVNHRVQNAPKIKILNSTF